MPALHFCLALVYSGGFSLQRHGTRQLTGTFSDITFHEEHELTTIVLLQPQASPNVFLFPELAQDCIVLASAMISPEHIFEIVTARIVVLHMYAKGQEAFALPFDMIHRAIKLLPVQHNPVATESTCSPYAL